MREGLKTLEQNRGKDLEPVEIRNMAALALNLACFTDKPEIYAEALYYADLLEKNAAEEVKLSQEAFKNNTKMTDQDREQLRLPLFAARKLKGHALIGIGDYERGRDMLKEVLSHKAMGDETSRIMLAYAVCAECLKQGDLPSAITLYSNEIFPHPRARTVGAQSSFDKFNFTERIFGYQGCCL